MATTVYNLSKKINCANGFAATAITIVLAVYHVETTLLVSDDQHLSSSNSALERHFIRFQQEKVQIHFVILIHGVIFQLLKGKHLICIICSLPSFSSRWSEGVYCLYRFMKFVLSCSSTMPSKNSRWNKIWSTLYTAQFL